MDLATEEKTAVENHQRQLRQQRENNHEEVKPRFFHLEDDLYWFEHAKYKHSYSL